MTATAAPARIELAARFGLDVVQVPPNRRCRRRDHPDVIFATMEAKERAVQSEIRRVHATGRPVLVGTASVAESERLASRLEGIDCAVLNARHDEREAAIVARAGVLHAVTISTNMAGRGTDIVLGDGVAALGGLYVIGTNRHESERIDLQLRGRAGRQGDPGSSRFFVSLEDPLFVRHRAGDLLGDVDRLPIPDDGPCTHRRVRREIRRAQTLVDALHAQIRARNDDVGAVLERHRREVHAWRDDVLHEPSTLAAIDDGWAKHLELIQALRDEDLELSVFRRRADAAFERRMIEIRNAAAPSDGALRPAAKWTFLLDEIPRRGLAYRRLDRLRVMVRDGFSGYTAEEAHASRPAR